MTAPLVLFLLQAEGGKPAHPGHKSIASVADDKRPVTAREAGQTFDRLANLFHRANGGSYGSASIPALNRPATRAEVVAEMDRFYSAAVPTIRFTPIPVRHDSKVFRIEAPQRAALERLVALGFVARIGPLATGPTTSLSPKEFGDAIGFFAARLAQVSHLPSPKWTPMLQGE